MDEQDGNCRLQQKRTIMDKSELQSKFQTNHRCHPTILPEMDEFATGFLVDDIADPYDGMCRDAAGWSFRMGDWWVSRLRGTHTGVAVMARLDNGPECNRVVQLAFYPCWIRWIQVHKPRVNPKEDEDEAQEENDPWTGMKEFW
jgi:hypothetical protein